MEILNDKLQKKIQNDILNAVLKNDYDSAIRNVDIIHDELTPAFQTINAFHMEEFI